jgi:SAM-dependent methyltransferase
MTEWFEDEALWEVAFPFLFPEGRLARSDEEVEQIVRMTGVGAGTALDLACGPGRHSLALARRGFAVTGVDRSAYLLGRARRHADAESLPVELVHADMRDFVRPDAFDLAINVFTSFGYFADRRDDLRVLENVHRSLKPAGVFVIELMGKERLASIFQPTNSEESPDGTIRFGRVRVTQAWSWLENDWTFVKDGVARTFRFSHRVYSARELIDLLEAAGFVAVEAFAGLSDQPYGPGSLRLAAVARKQG